MNNGGYIMVDMTGWTVGTAGEIPGIYKRLSEAINTGKPIFISGFSAAGANTPRNVTMYMDASDKIQIDYNGIDFAVSADDTISI